MRHESVSIRDMDYEEDLNLNKQKATNDKQSDLEFWIPDRSHNKPMLWQGYFMKTTLKFPY